MKQFTRLVGNNESTIFTPKGGRYYFFIGQPVNVLDEEDIAYFETLDSVVPFEMAKEILNAEEEISNEDNAELTSAKRGRKKKE